MDYSTVQARPFRPAALRFLIISALAKGKSLIAPVPEGQDIAALRTILCDCGAHIADVGPDTWEITGTAAPFSSLRPAEKQEENAPDAENTPAPADASAEAPAEVPAEPEKQPQALEIHTGASAALCRLLLPVLAAGTGSFHVRTADRVRQMALNSLLGSLAMQGVDFDHEGSSALPLTMHTSGLPGGTVMVNSDESSQNLSAMLMAAPLAADALTVEVNGTHAAGWPYIALTLKIMQDFGAKFDVSVRDSRAAEWKIAEWRKMKVLKPGMVRFRVRSGGYKAGMQTVEGDWAASAPLLAAGALGKAVRVLGLSRYTMQGGQIMHTILQAFGAKCDADTNDFAVAPAELHGINADLSLCPDLAPAVAVLAAFAKGNTLLRGLENQPDAWDKVSALRLELGKSGIATEAHPEGIVVVGDPERDMQGKKLNLLTHNNPYLASALVLLNLRGASVSLDKPVLAARTAEFVLSDAAN